MNFKAIVISNESGVHRAQFREIGQSDLPQGSVTVEIKYSSLNYKDALAITGRGPVVRSFPMIPGIDFAGKVLQSSDHNYLPGDEVLLTGWGVGEKHFGGLSQRACVPGEWLTSLPSGMSTKMAMGVGTAGFTAMLSVEALLRHGVCPEDGPVLVTGASGGVGSFAITILKKLGFKVTASTGRPEQVARLFRELNVDEVIDRHQLSIPGKPLQKERWFSVIDTVGSHTLSNACAATRYGGIVAACGMSQGLDFMSSVAPFILRGITLRGIDSVMVNKSLRSEIWDKLAALFSSDEINSLTTTVPLSMSIQAASDLLSGQNSGRVIIDCE